MKPPSASGPSDVERLEVVRDLIGLARADWSYLDLYLLEAEEVLSAILSPDRCRSLLEEPAQLRRLGDSLRWAVRRGAWKEAEQVAERGSRARRSADSHVREREVAEAIHRRRGPDPNPTALALSGAVAHPASALEREVQRLRASLEKLASQDLRWSEIYQERALELAAIAVGKESHEAAAHVDPGALREEAIRAADESSFETVLRIARGATQRRTDPLGRVRAPRARNECTSRLAEAPARAVLDHATGLGLGVFDLAPRADLNSYLSCCCADRPRFPAESSEEGSRVLDDCTCGHACPPQVSKAVQESLDALMVHPFVSSAGARYLPWFGKEVILAETFDERQPDAPSGLLDKLRLPKRRGVARREIDDALLRYGPGVCADLALDPHLYRVVCIPFDAYARLAPQHGWGERELWTHFDGYRVTGRLALQALVGGDARFGGPADLCSVGIDYASEHITARFCVVRRERFRVRQALQ